MFRFIFTLSFSNSPLTFSISFLQTTVVISSSRLDNEMVGNKVIDMLHQAMMDAAIKARLRVFNEKEVKDKSMMLHRPKSCSRLLVSIDARLL